MKKYFAEFLGTFILIFCGTGAVVVNQLSNGAIGHIGIATTFGLIVMVIIYSLGAVSGAHINPAVSIALAVADKFEKKEVLPYIVSQVSGALSASLTLKLMFPLATTLGATLPAGSQMQSFVLEILLTFLLMFVIMNVTQGSKETGWLAGIIIGAMVLLEALFAGPISGASMNPARSIGPAVVSGNVADLWIYIAAPIVGAILGVFAWKILK